MKHKNLNITAFILIFIFIAFLLLKDPFIGLADNTDYYRVIQPLGFETKGLERYYNSYNFYKINNVSNKDIMSSLKYIINPEVENNNNYFSTQFIFIKISMIINFFIKLLLNKDVEIFNIKILGMLYTAIYSYGLYLFLKNIKIRSLLLKIIFIILSFIILCDIGYIIYFNSFFGEAPIIASLMLAVGSCLALIKSKENRKDTYFSLIFFLSSILFVGAKVANTPIGILISLFSLTLLMIKKHKITKYIIISGSIIIMIFSVFYYVSAPKWMNQVNNYQAIFYGILKDSPTPEEDMKQLDISEKYLSLAGTHGFIKEKQFDIYSDEFQKEVYDKASFVNVTKFYLLNPNRLIDKLILSADNSVIIQPSYLGNFKSDDGFERLSFTNRFSIWGNLRKNTLGSAFYIIGVYSIIFFIININELLQSIKNKKHIKTVYGFAGILLFLTTMIQFVLPVIGNGEADLQKHMLLFNICFDMMILVGVLWLFNNYKNKVVLKMMPVIAVSIIILFLIAPLNNAAKTNMTLETGDYIQFGSYKQSPLNWIILKYDNNGYLIWSENSIDKMEFDIKDEQIKENKYGSNNWESSDIRNYLNSDFKNNFSSKEQEIINKIQLKNVLTYNNIQIKDGGNKPYFWTAITSYVDQNYAADAYYKNSVDKIFLLDTFQLKNYVYDNNIDYKKNTRYWLRTPYYSNESMVRIVGEDGLVYHKDANVKAGIIPALYINETLKIKSGNGTKNNPYIIMP